MNAKNKIPFTIITGFLGAGKTTFINDLLKNNPDIRFALVENEFGEIAVDTKLIKGIEASQMFELKNGCICCTITDEYEQALKELAERFPEIDYLLIETSGIADPVPVIRPFFNDVELKKLYRFSGTVCMADARYFHRYPAKKIAFRQLAVADSVIITKTEDFGKIDKEKFLHELRNLNFLAVYHISDFGHVPDFNLEDIQHKIKIVSDFTPANAMHEHLQTETFRMQKPLDKLQFTEWLSYTLDLYKTEIYRNKGILCFENEPFEYILQGVGGSFELVEGEDLSKSDKSQVVLIGFNLPKIHFPFL